MKILPFEEYKKEQRKWSDKYSEYMDKLMFINSCENDISSDELTKEIEDIFEKERQQLSEQYKGFTSAFDADFGCYLSKENIDDLFGTHLSKNIWKDELKKIGHTVEVNNGNYIGTLTGIVYAIDDLYYEIQKENGNIVYETGVSKVKIIPATKVYDYEKYLYNQQCTH